MSEEDAPVQPKGPEIVDSLAVETLYVDWVITGGAHGNVVNISLGTLDYAIPGANAGFARVIVASRLRCSREFAERLQGFLGEILSQKPPEEPPPKPPASRLN